MALSTSSRFAPGIKLVRKYSRSVSGVAPAPMSTMASSIVLPIMIGTPSCTWPDLRAWSGLWRRTAPSMVGAHDAKFFSATRSVFASASLRHVHVGPGRWHSSAPAQPTAWRMRSYCSSASAKLRAALWMKPPLIMTAELNKPLLLGIARWTLAEAAPAAQPKTEMRRGSPPKCAMCRRTQRSASCWSKMPKLPVLALADARKRSLPRKPKTPKR
mmetsp:Transcript_14330/g.41362  ORF Transcript_14330/g.41362 Transcript_14330/m.41362 type:complete len:215 (+) Transcript_14330:147-791(+)